MKKVVIIGGMAAGCKAASRLKRISEEFEVTIVEKKGFISYGTCGMPLFAAGEVDSFYDLAKTPYSIIRNEDFFLKAKGVKILTNTEAANIDITRKIVKCKEFQSDGEFELELEYDSLLIATGAKVKLPPINIPDCERISTFHNPMDAKKFREMAQKGKIVSAAILGGGYIACELAEALTTTWGIETHIIEIENRLMPRIFDADISKLLEKIFTSEGINLHLGCKAGTITINDEGCPVLKLDSNEAISTDYLFITTGVEPEPGPALSCGIMTGSNGGIKVDSRMRTSIPSVWAAGDCVEVINTITGKYDYMPLGSLANRQGRAAADSIAGLAGGFANPCGTASIKVFGLIAACSGLNFQRAEKEGFDPAAVFGSWYDRPDYHPDAKNLFAKMLYDKDSRKILGLQLIGRGEVTRYIDSFSVYLSKGAVFDDLLNFEHAYTPPHSSPVNPLNCLASMAAAQEDRDIICLDYRDLNNFRGQLLDLRQKEEIDENPCPIECRNFSVTDYRSKIGEFDKDQPLLLICQKGPRSFEAAHYFRNCGFKNVFYLGGGIQALLGLTGTED